jgi:hypothetical protein
MIYRWQFAIRIYKTFRLNGVGKWWLQCYLPFHGSILIGFFYHKIDIPLFMYTS